TYASVIGEGRADLPRPDRRSNVGRANFGQAAPSIYASVSFRQGRPAKSTGLGFTADSLLPVHVSHQRALANLSPWRRCALPFPHSSNHRYSIDTERELHTCRCDPHKEARLARPPVDLLRERRHPSAVAVLPSALLVHRLNSVRRF